MRRIAKWYCPACGEKFIWNDDDPDDRVWVETIWAIMANHQDRCSARRVKV